MVSNGMQRLGITFAAVVGVGGGSVAHAAPLAGVPGRFFTRAGRTELREKSVVLDISKSNRNDLTVRITLRLPDAPPATNRESDFAVTLKPPKVNAAWFVYTEDGKRFWLYDGKEAGLMHVAAEQEALPGRTESTIIQRYKAADAAMLKGAPKAVRERLQQARFAAGRAR